MNKKEFRSLMCSMLLGDGHIARRERDPAFIFEHSCNQGDYADWKADLLDSVFIDKVLPRRCRRRITTQWVKDKSYQCYRVELYWKQYFSIMRKRCYKYDKERNKPKKNVEYILSQMNSDLHTAIWFGDDGGEMNDRSKERIGTPYYALYTYEFTEGQLNLAIEWFKQRYGIIPYKLYLKPNKSYYLRFHAEDALILKPIIVKHLKGIKSMELKFANSFSNILSVGEGSEAREETPE